ncbi:hypothetical protein G6F22_020692 [Rhizopus arrhizus]|nr:hypothetical protein G6F22_020692 [Rhizopus arrhizus]
MGRPTGDSLASCASIASRNALRRASPSADAGCVCSSSTDPIASAARRRWRHCGQCSRWAPATMLNGAGSAPAA